MMLLDIVVVQLYQLPIINAMGIECLFVPTAILSVNTRHPEFYFDDYTSRMNDYINTYKQMKVSVDGIVTGFLGSEQQIDIVIDFINTFKKADDFVLIDPVMGDNGKLYATYNLEMQQKMRELIPYATMMTPNLTELCALLDVPYPSTMFNEAELLNMCQQLTTMGPKMVVVTGIDAGDTIINFAYEAGKEPKVIKVNRIGEDRSGTGDVISAVLAGNYARGLNFYQSVEKATDFASKCIQYCQDINAHPHLGLCFEPFLKEL